MFPDFLPFHTSNHEDAQHHSGPVRFARVRDASGDVWDPARAPSAVTNPPEAVPAPALFASAPGARAVPIPDTFEPHVYAVMGEGGVLLYVGQTHNVFERLARHQRRLRAIGAARPVALVYAPVPGPQAPYVEEAAIRVLRPETNVSRVRTLSRRHVLGLESSGWAAHLFGEGALAP